MSKDGEGSVVVMVRWGLHKVEGSKQMECDRCGAVCALSPATEQGVKELEEPIVYSCVPCALKDIREQEAKGEEVDILEPTEAQMKEGKESLKKIGLN